MKYTCKIDENLQKEGNQKGRRNIVTMLVAGIVGLVAYIAISLFVESPYLDYLLWPSAIFFAFGVVLLFVMNKTNKTTIAKNMVDEYEIFEDHIVVDSYQNGEKTVSVKTYFKDIIKIDETKNYFFLYPSKQAAYPVPKNEFSPEELEKLITKIKSLIKK